MIHFQGDFTSFQEGATRLEKAMSGIPDRVPVYAQIHEFAMHELGVPAREFYTLPEILVPGTLEILEKYDIDVAFVDYDVYNIEAEALGQRVVYNDDHMPDVDRTAPLITDPEDLDRIRTPDFDSEGRFPVILKMHGLFRKLTGLDPALQFCAPFSLAANIRGIEQLLIDVYTSPEFAGDLFERLTEEVIAPWIEHQKRCFPTATSITGSDATASLPIVNLDILERWILPYILRLRELCGPKVIVPNWVGERYLNTPETRNRMLDLKLQVCPSFVEGQDPDVEVLGPTLYKSYAQKHDVPLVLGVGAGFLARANAMEVVDRVKNYAQIGGQDGRFALYLCNVGATTPRENVKAAIDAVRVYGAYQ